MTKRSAHVAGFLAIVSLPLFAGELRIDHRYAPERQYTLLSFPFDWQKSIILGNGSLAFDFGPGPYHAAGTEISIGVPGRNLEVREQYFVDPDVPIATTTFGSGDALMIQEAFSLMPSSFSIPSSFSRERVRRVSHLAGTIAWAEPNVQADPAFRNVAWGTNRPVTYRVKVDPGSRKTVALGLCEAYKSGPGQRVLELRVEGGDPQVLDPMKDRELNRPYVLLFHGRDVNGDGELTIEARSAPESPDPNVILNAVWVFPEGMPVTPGAVLRGDMTRSAEVYVKCGTELMNLVRRTRSDALIATVGDPDATPAIIITTHRPVTCDSASGIITMGEGLKIHCSPSPWHGESVAVGRSRRWTFPLPRGTRRVELVIEHGNGLKPSRGQTDLRKERVLAGEYWKTRTGIPKNKIIVPDSALQRILDVNIRNIYQAADLVEGYPVFQPGPTVYRGLFLLDILLIGEPLMLLGDIASARKYIEGTFRYQQPDGRVRVVTPYNSYLETPAFVHALGRYARWTGDRPWMVRQWNRMVRGIDWIKKERSSTMTDPAAPNFGLFPPGFVDGGVSGSVADFSTAEFALVALETGIDIAAWLDHRKEEEEWRSLFEDLMGTYVSAARKSLRVDRHGTTYLPVVVGDTSTTAPPQRGQYGFFGPLRYGKYFNRHIPFLDTLVAGNMTMLDSTLREGMAVDAGWTKDAVWSWFAAMHAVTLSWYGQHERALQMVYDVGNHAGRLGTWVEEQPIAGKGTYSTGDGANAEASAYFVTAMRHLLVYEREKTIELLPGVPSEWYRRGARIALNDVPLWGGRLTLESDVSQDGSSLRIRTTYRPNSRSDMDSTVFTLPARMVRDAGFTACNGQPMEEHLSFRCSTRAEFIFTKRK